jgi:hypothetical protein
MTVGIFVLRPVRVPHENSIAPAMPRIARVDFQHVKRETPGNRAGNREVLYRAGDNRLTA